MAQSLSLHLPDFADTPAMALLALAAFCHPDRIPVDVLFETMKLSKEEAEDWLVKLDEVSIIHYAGETISLHRLMQDFIRTRMHEDAARSTLTVLVRFLCARFEDPEGYRNWPIQDNYAVHAEGALEYADRMGGITQAGFLGNNLGVYLQNRARFDPALKALRVAERIVRAAYGDDHPEVATRVNNIGAVLRDIGELEAAVKCFRDAERISREHYGDEHPIVALRTNNVGSVLWDKGDLDGALKCHREAERIRRAAYGNEHPDVAVDVNNVGTVLMDKGDLDGALTCFREAERIDRAFYGNTDPNVAIDVNNIGNVLQDKGDPDEALDCFREAERIDRAAYGDVHPVVARDISNIGSVLMAMGDVDGARANWSKAFGILIATGGPRAVHTIRVAKNLARAGVDPIPLAREIAGDEAANQLDEALRSQSSE